MSDTKIRFEWEWQIKLREKDAEIERLKSLITELAHALYVQTGLISPDEKLV